MYFPMNTTNESSRIGYSLSYSHYNFLKVLEYGRTKLLALIVRSYQNEVVGTIVSEQLLEKE